MNNNNQGTFQESTDDNSAHKSENEPVIEIRLSASKSTEEFEMNNSYVLGYN